MVEHKVVRTTPADENNQVVTVVGGEGHMPRVCGQCPWDSENDGNFPAEAFRVSAHTCTDMASETFGCHMSGVTRPRTCAGFLLSESALHNLSVRMRLIENKIDLDAIDDRGADLHPNYTAMAVANGVSADDPALRGLR